LKEKSKSELIVLIKFFNERKHAGSKAATCASADTD